MNPDSLKELLLKRASGLCEYCKSPANISSQPFVIEHITPKSKGGKTTPENVALSCQGCNNHKYNKLIGVDPVTLQKSELFNPRKHNWEDHFRWSDSLTEIIPVTLIGRVSLQELKLNRKELINLRSLLIIADKHPPD